MSFAHVIEAKRAAALEYLGANWVLHPEYSADKNPQHALTLRVSVRLASFLAARRRAKRSEFLRT